MSSYVKPNTVSDDMGGIGNELDSRMKDIFALLNYMPEGLQTCIHVEYGKEQIKYDMKRRGMQVTAIGLEIESYGADLSKAKDEQINIIEADVTNMPFAGQSFDCVIASHILEHVPNMGLALQEIRRVVDDDGWFLLFIPRWTEFVCAGHINTGWNLGQLIYVLCVNGFDVKNGNFIEYGYSLCAFVKKSRLELPPLRGDRGDIEILSRNGFLPFKVSNQYNNDGYNGGKIIAVNWKHIEIFKQRESNKKNEKLVLILYKILVKLLGEARVAKIGVSFIRNTENSLINPKAV